MAEEGSELLQLNSISVGLNALVTIGLSPPAWAVVVPSNLEPGDEFHFVFLTRDNEHGQRTLAFYNEFVNTQAQQAGSLTESIDTDWRAIASTASVDARDNAPVGDHTPIYLLDGTLVAMGGLDLWGGSILNPISLNQFGEHVTDTVWTGSRADGTGLGGRALEQCIDFGCLVRTGFSASTHAAWISRLDLVSGNRMKLYALSDIMAVPVPEPSILFLFSAGIVGLATSRQAMTEDHERR